MRVLGLESWESEADVRSGYWRVGSLKLVAGVLVVMVRAGSVGPPSSASGVKPVEPAALQSETDCRPVHIAVLLLVSSLLDSWG